MDESQFNPWNEEDSEGMFEKDVVFEMAKVLESMDDEVQMVTGMVVAFQFMDSDNEAGWGVISLKGQTSIVTNGLVDAAMATARERFSHDRH